MPNEARDRGALWIGITSGIVGLAWTGAAVAMSGRGLDVTDEGFYLLSYRWWASNSYTFTGVQYVFGPLYQALGYDAQLLRLSRVVLVLAAHLALGVGAASWIRDTASHPISASARRVIAGAVTAAGGLTLAWGPLTPGYNDVSVLSTLVLAAAVLTIHRYALLGRQLPVAVAFVMGPVIVVFALSKWSSALVTVPFVSLVAALALRRLSPRGLGAWLATAAASTAGTALLVHLLIKPWPEIVKPIIQVTNNLGTGSNSPSALVDAYLMTTTMLGIFAAVPAAIAATMVLMARRLPAREAARATAAAPVLAVLLALVIVGGIRGGADGVRDYSSVLVSSALSVWIVFALSRSERGPRTPGSGFLVAMLVLLPGVQALGTGNPIFLLAINGFPLWLVTLLWIWASSPPRPGLREGAGAVCGGLILVIGWVTVSGILAYPFRTSSYLKSTTPVSAESVGTLRVSPEAARQFASLQRATAAASPTSPVMAFDELAGLVLILDGRSVGEAWYSSSDQTRTAQGIKNYCESHRDPWSSGRPIIVLNRAITSLDTDALRHCGLSFYSDFTMVPVPRGPEDVTLYLPRQGES